MLNIKNLKMNVHIVYHKIKLYFERAQNEAGIFVTFRFMYFNSNFLWTIEYQISHILASLLKYNSKG